MARGLGGVSAAATRCSQAPPATLIELCRPEVLVKGGDWKPEQIVGADVVKALGGEVLSLKLVDGFSTTALVEKIRNGG